MQPEDINNPNNAKAVPFFARFLEGQLDPDLYQDVSEEEMETLSGGKRVTRKYPSDGEDGNPVTLKYPSDKEDGPINVTLKYPSDNDEANATS